MNFMSILCENPRRQLIVWIVPNNILFLPLKEPGLRSAYIIWSTRCYVDIILINKVLTTFSNLPCTQRKPRAKTSYYSLASETPGQEFDTSWQTMQTLLPPFLHTWRNLLDICWEKINSVNSKSRYCLYYVQFKCIVLV